VPIQAMATSSRWEQRRITLLIKQFLNPLPRRHQIQGTPT